MNDSLRVFTLFVLLMLTQMGAGSKLALAQDQPSEPQNINTDSQSSDVPYGAFRRRFGGAGGARWQSLTPAQKKALVEKIRERRAQRTSGSVPSASLPSNIADVAIKSDVPYGKDALQRLDVYSPKVSSGKQPMPVVIFVHGGGWSRGDKGQRDHKAKGCAYVAENIIFVSTNYRLAPNVMHPKQIEDVAEAFAWVKKNASQFNGDPNKIYLMGHSAGAHLVDLLGTNDKYLSAVGLSLKDINGVISLDTASLDLTTRRNDDGPETKFVGPMIDEAFGKNPAVLKDASPTLAIQQGKTYPPFLMYCGSKRLNCVQQHRQFESALKKAGGVVTVSPLPLSHADINRASGQPGTEIFKGCMQMIKG